MKRKLAAGVLSVALLIGGATVVVGATDSTKLDEIKSLTQQMFGIHKQIVDKEVEAGLLTQQQADAMKKSIDQRQQKNEKALANGKAIGPGAGKRGGMKFNNGQPMTEEQIKTWSDSMQARLTAQEEAMKKNSTLTDEQLKIWSDAAQAQLKIQVEAMKEGKFVPGGLGIPGAKGMPGCNFSRTEAPDTSAPTS